jgi:hypothetical protein
LTIIFLLYQFDSPNPGWFGTPIEKYDRICPVIWIRRLELKVLQPFDMYERLRKENEHATRCKENSMELLNRLGNGKESGTTNNFFFSDLGRPPHLEAGGHRDQEH